jgi:hypothetical protein
MANTGLNQGWTGTTTRLEPLGFLKDDILACVEISYRVIISWRNLVSFRDFGKIMFLHGEMSEFSQFFFILKIHTFLM